MPTRAYVPEVAYLAERLYLLYDHEVHAIDREGHVTDIFPAPEGHFLRALDTIPSGRDTPSALVVAASPLRDVEASTLLVYRLAAADYQAMP